jgi:hypothetical protein
MCVCMCVYVCVCVRVCLGRHYQDKGSYNHKMCSLARMCSLVCLGMVGFKKLNRTSRTNDSSYSSTQS